MKVPNKKITDKYLRNIKIVVLTAVLLLISSTIISSAQERDVTRKAVKVDPKILDAIPVIKNAIMHHREEIGSIMVCCYQGRHRSVSLSRLFREMLNRNGSGGDIVHLHRRLWWPHKGNGFQNKCSDCDVWNFGKLNIYEHIAKLW